MLFKLAPSDNDPSDGRIECKMVGCFVRPE